MSPHAFEPEIVWPDLDSSYVDEFGPIDRAVYEIARKAWPVLVPSIRRTLRDLHAGQTVMMRAAALVSRKVNEDPQKITSVHGYLYRTFVRLLSEEVKKQGKHAELNRASLAQEDIDAARADEVIYERILIHQILERANPKTRKVFQLRMLGHNFEEIAAQLGLQSNHLRSLWSKEIRRLITIIEMETREAERRVLEQKQKKLEDD
jgi:DNA-directed RNA polymerase specialized sigma24 family protein